MGLNTLTPKGAAPQSQKQLLRLCHPASVRAGDLLFLESPNVHNAQRR